MSPEAQRVRDLFVAAVQLPPDQWEGFLEGACAADEELRRQVGELLREHQQAGSFLDQPAAYLRATGALDPTGDGAAAAVQEGPGTTIGPYKLLELIGEGGMGAVWMAEQREPVQRKVALKIIKAGMDTRQVVARFEAERQALALMDHPNIAKVLDGGTTDTGRPYFVMELVKGTPITRYCDEHRLTPRERLELFLPVCRAIQHAHTKGIIHRDIKPSNVLVAPYDGVPVPKVIDFGVAKATGQRLTERTLFTGCGAVVGTLEYMSPEQAELNNQDIDTRSDIYSLGVLLYELLTGTTPLRHERLKQAAFTETLRVIREEEPPRPSARLSASGEALPAISAQRHMEPARLTKLVRGELDWVVMKALEKDRTRRYESGSAFAADVQRYLADEPVQACPPTLGYRLRKLYRRNRVVATLLGTVAFLLVVGTVGTSVLALVAHRAAVRADENAEKMRQEKEESDRQRDRAEGFLYASQLESAQSAWRENDPRVARLHLTETNPERRGWEYRLLDNLFNHLGQRTFHGHTGTVFSVCFSPDGRRLASASGDGTVKVWDTDRGQEIFTTKERYNFWVTSVSFSPDGRRLASGGLITYEDQPGEVKVWDVDKGQEILNLKGHSIGVTSVSFSPDGRRLASASADGTVKVWDVDRGQEVLTFKGPTTGVRSVCFSPDGRRLAGASGSLDRQGRSLPGEVKVWDADRGQEVLSLKTHTNPVCRVCFSPDGRRLASASADGTVQVWDTDRGQEVLTLKGKHVGFTSVCFSPDGHRLAGAGGDKMVRIWNANTGQEALTLKGHTGPVFSVCFSPDGHHVASASQDKTVKVWDVDRGQEVLTLKGSAWSVRFSPDGRLLAGGSWDQTVKVWDADTGQEVRTLKGHAVDVRMKDISPDLRRLAGTGEGQYPDHPREVKVWDADGGQEVLTLKGHTRCVMSVCFSPDGRHLASASCDQTVKVWDADGGQEVLTLKGHTGYVWRVCFSPDGRRLASVSSDETVKVWGVDTGQEVRTLKGRINSLSTVCFSPDGRHLAHSNVDGTVKVWDVNTGQETLTLNGHTAEVTSLCFSPDSRRLVSGSRDDQTVRIWDTATGQEVLTLKGETGVVSFSPDGRRLGSHTLDGTVKVWDAGNESGGSLP
jgi:WD40 repeat protein/serine/threonine protein kinase